MGKETGVKAGKTGEVPSRVSLTRVGFASVTLGLLLGALLLVQTPAETTPKTTYVTPSDTDG